MSTQQKIDGWNDGVEPYELLKAEDVPFNLAGELIDNSTTAEGEARVRALAESEAKKAQLTLGFGAY